MSDLNFQDISTVQNNLQPGPATIASAPTVTPRTFISMITGTAAIANITPPVTGSHMLCFIFAAAATFVTTGNIQLATVIVTNVPVFLVYNPLTGKYYGK